MVPRLHLVTDDAVLADAGFADAAAAVLECGAGDVALHLRGHGTAARRLYELGEALADACLRSGCWLLINDRVDIAMAVRANGVQLGARSLRVADARALLGRHAPVGVSVHGAPETVAAATDGADFVLMGSIWKSPSHPEDAPAGLDALRTCSARAGVPVIAIGGVTPERVTEAAAAGAHGVAVLGGVWHAERQAAAAGAYLDAIRTIWPDQAGRA